MRFGWAVETEPQPDARAARPQIWHHWDKCRPASQGTHRRPMTARQTAIATIANHKIASTQDYLEHAGEAIYGQYVFSEDAQRDYLAKPVFKKLRRTIEGHEPFDPAIMDAVAQG